MVKRQILIFPSLGKIWKLLSPQLFPGFAQDNDEKKKKRKLMQQAEANVADKGHKTTREPQQVVTFLVYEVVDQHFIDSISKLCSRNN